MQFTLHGTEIPGLEIIEHQPTTDSRGFFERLYCTESLGTRLSPTDTIRQINRSHTGRKFTVRGLHFQYPPAAETKIVTCLKGRVWDVAVDIRKGSPTFLQYQSVLLTDRNHLSFLIPEGFAHGFQTLTSDCELLYLHTADYDPASEGTLDALDPTIGIDWPDKISERSERDQRHTSTAASFEGVLL